jgi:hypothetical protein
MNGGCVKNKEREYKLPNGEILKMTEEEFRLLVEYFITLEKIRLTTKPPHSSETFCRR